MARLLTEQDEIRCPHGGLLVLKPDTATGYSMTCDGHKVLTVNRIKAGKFVSCTHCVSNIPSPCLKVFQIIDTASLSPPLLTIDGDKAVSEKVRFITNNTGCIAKPKCENTSHSVSYDKSNKQILDDIASDPQIWNDMKKEGIIGSPTPQRANLRENVAEESAEPALPAKPSPLFDQIFLEDIYARNEMLTDTLAAIEKFRTYAASLTYFKYLAIVGVGILGKFTEQMFIDVLKKEAETQLTDRIGDTSLGLLKNKAFAKNINILTHLGGTVPGIHLFKLGRYELLHNDTINKYQEVLESVEIENSKGKKKWTSSISKPINGIKPYNTAFFDFILSDQNNGSGNVQN